MVFKDMVDYDMEKLEEEKDDGGGNCGRNDEATIAKWKSLMDLRSSDRKTKSSIKSKPKFKKKKPLPKGAKSKAGKGSGIGTGRGKSVSTQWSIGNIGGFFLTRSKGNSPGS